MQRAIEYLKNLGLSAEGYDSTKYTPCCGELSILIVNTETKEVSAKCQCGKKYDFSQLLTFHELMELIKKTGHGTKSCYAYAGYESNVFSPCCGQEIKGIYSYHFMVDRNFLYECDKCGKIFTTKEVLTENDMKIKKRVDLIDNVID